MAWWCVAASTALLLSACGKPLGSYTVDRVSPADPRHLRAIDPAGGNDYGALEIVRLDLSSTTDVIEASDEGDLYLWGGACPLQDTGTLVIDGPYPDDKWDILSTTHTPQADGSELVSSVIRHPVRGRDGRYRYSAYLVMYPAAAKAMAAAGPDLCLRFDHPGYHLKPSRSTVFTLSKDRVREALGTAREDARPEHLRSAPPSPK